MINELLQQTLAASRQLVMLDDVTINRILTDTASALLSHQTKVLTANAEDLQLMDPANPKYDRLKLTEERLAGIAGDMKNVASLPSPLGKLLSETTRPNSMVIRKITVPFGVIGVIYEARPNVTFDVFSLCLKSGNACVLKGGSDADSTNRALVAIIHNVLAKQGVNPAVCTLLPPDREATTELLNAVGLVDLIIPRGSSSRPCPCAGYRDGSRYLPHLFRQGRRQRKRTRNRQQCQDTSRQRLQRSGLPDRPSRPVRRLDLSVRQAVRQQRRYLCRRTGLCRSFRTLSCRFTSAGYSRQLRYRVLRLQNGDPYSLLLG